MIEVFVTSRGGFCHLPTPLLSPPADRELNDINGLQSFGDPCTSTGKGRSTAGRRPWGRHPAGSDVLKGSVSISRCACVRGRPWPSRRVKGQVRHVPRS